ncbi:MAG: hypothetical protein A3F16_06325 [Deltaproteobacteria bacterium RIFCSPHIGHO2_12_FULL_43_9]|nr:MAG: hypothetical protein A3F16_06325 [Deltaproteobacteria bacterium RIFCSPHIGHO2_12_FULL_43_9]
MKDKPELSVVIPAYREEENLKVLLPRLTKSLKETNHAYEVLVVDTESPMDDLASVCAENSVNYINRTGGNDYGDAIRTGIRESRGKYLLFMDADGSHSPEFITELMPYRNDFDVVVASRYVKGGDTENPKILILMSWLLNLSYSFVLNLKCKDVSNSFKLYRADQIKDLGLYCQNFDIVEEILYKLNKKYPIKIKELPFTFKKRLFGESKRNLILFMITYLYTLLKLRFGK